MQKVIDAIIFLPYLAILISAICDLYVMLNLRRPQNEELAPLLGVVSPQEEKTRK